MSRTGGRTSRTIAAAVGVVVACGVAGAPATNAAPPAKSFVDRSGELVGAPDIGKLTAVQHGQVLTVEADVRQLPKPLAETGTVVFGLDTDGNRETGAFRGAEYVLRMDIKQRRGETLRWNGREYVLAKKVAAPNRLLIGDAGVGFSFNLANFGWPKRIGLTLLAVRGPADSVLRDWAPGTGLWPLAIRPAMKELNLTFVPGRPRAGDAFAARRPRLRLTDGSRVVPGTLSCKARLDGAPLEQLGSGRLCRWQIPPGSAGKLLVLSATAAFGGESSEFGDWKFRVRGATAGRGSGR